jgi:hypothetical protein
MKKIINVLVDTGNLSQNALVELSLETEFDINVLTLDLFDLDSNHELLQDLEGLLLVLLSPMTFSLYRGKLYQELVSNKKIQAFEFLRDSMHGRIAKWAYCGENTKTSLSSKIGLMTYVGSNSIIGSNSSIGNFCWIGNNVTIASGVVIGNNVTIHDGVVIGSSAKLGKFNEIRNSIQPSTNLSSKVIETDFYGTTAHIHGL